MPNHSDEKNRLHFKKKEAKSNNCYHDVNTENDSEFNIQRISPEMQKVIHDEIRNILYNLQTQLEEFVRFVEEIEEQTPKEINTPISSQLHSKEPFLHPDYHSNSLYAPDTKTDHAALRDAFSMVRQLLLRIADMLQEIASKFCGNDASKNFQSSPFFDLYYSQYVYQIAFYILQITGEQVSIFSEALCRRTLPCPSTEYVKDTSSQRDNVSTPSNSSSLTKRLSNTEFEQIHNFEEAVNREKVPENDKRYTDKFSQTPERLLTEIDIKAQMVDILDLLAFMIEHVSLYLQCRGSQELTFRSIDTSVSSPESEKQFLQKVCKIESCTSLNCKKCCDTCRYSHLMQDQRTFFQDAGSKYDAQRSSPYRRPITRDSLVEESFFPQGETSRYKQKRSSRPRISFENGFTDSKNISKISTIDRTFPSEEIVYSWRSDSDEHAGTKIINLRGKKCHSKSSEDNDTVEMSSSEMEDDQNNKMQKNYQAEDLQSKSISPDTRTETVTEKEDSTRFPTSLQHSEDMVFQESRHFDDPRGPVWGFCVLPTVSKENYQNEGNNMAKSKADEKFMESSPFVKFDSQKFSRLVEEELDKYHQQCEEISGNPEERESTAIVNLLIRCFRESCGNMDEKYQEKYCSVGTAFPEKGENAKEKERPKPIPLLDDSPVSEKMVEKFVSDTLNLASQIIQKKEKRNSKLPNRKDIDTEKWRVTKEENILESPKEEETHETLNDVYRSCSLESHFLISDIVRGVPTSQLFKHPESSKEATGEQDSSFWTGCPKVSTLHRSDDKIPQGLMEVRKVVNGSVQVSLTEWDEKDERTNWKWNKSFLCNTPRVHVAQQATSINEPVFKVYFGSRGRQPRCTAGETQLQIVREVAEKATANLQEKSSNASMHLSKSEPKDFSSELKASASEPDIMGMNLVTAKDWNFMNKLWIFFDDLHKHGYGEGPPLIIRVRRECFLQDAFDIFMTPSRIPLNYYRCLKVILIDNDSSEDISTQKELFEHQDDTDELFDMLSNQLYTPKYLQLFDFPSDETQYVYFNPHTSYLLQWFEFAGKVLALCILHQKRIETKLPLCLFKGLLDRPITMLDLKEIDPLLYQRLKWLKDNNVNSRKISMTFTMKERVNAHTVESELIQNGSKIVITDENKFSYIEKAVIWKLAEKCLPELNEFRKGFISVLEPSLLSIFSERELREMISKKMEDTQNNNESINEKRDPTNRRATWG
ncbi:uncharacterized protein LOC118188675 [Stegodyphus dumicola]|uniref:uncharacterized protein LOC118188675 n=1 Tax=Stegodyphus dumicola TaxID=202533 RepID=UPI0015AB53C1|nr:uncharacterized protein LOC118188675 [Stegodyphus dumicola]